MKTLDVKIKGMDCADCTAQVQKAIEGVPAVEYAQVFLGAEKARIGYNRTAPDLVQVQNAVKAAGYEAVLHDDIAPEKEKSDSNALGKKLLTGLGLVIGLVLFVSVVGEWLGLFSQVRTFIPWYVWLAAILVGGWPIFTNVVRAAVRGQIISHSLMTLGVIAAIAVGEWPTAAIVVLFMRIGDFVEGFTTGKARDAIRDLTELTPQTAVRPEKFTRRKGTHP